MSAAVYVTLGIINSAARESTHLTCTYASIASTSFCNRMFYMSQANLRYIRNERRPDTGIASNKRIILDEKEVSWQHRRIFASGSGQLQSKMSWVKNKVVRNFHSYKNVKADKIRVVDSFKLSYPIRIAGKAVGFERSKATYIWLLKTWLRSRFSVAIAFEKTLQILCVDLTIET